MHAFQNLHRDFWQQGFVPESIPNLNSNYEEQPRRLNRILPQIFNLILPCHLIYMHGCIHRLDEIKGTQIIHLIIGVLFCQCRSFASNDTLRSLHLAELVNLLHHRRAHQKFKTSPATETLLFEET